MRQINSMTNEGSNLGSAPAVLVRGLYGMQWSRARIHFLMKLVIVALVTIFCSPVEGTGFAERLLAMQQLWAELTDMVRPFGTLERLSETALETAARSGGIVEGTIQPRGGGTGIRFRVRLTELQTNVNGGLTAYRRFSLGSLQIVEEGIMLLDPTRTLPRTLDLGRQMSPRLELAEAINRANNRINPRINAAVGGGGGVRLTPGNVGLTVLAAAYIIFTAESERDIVAGFGEMGAIWGLSSVAGPPGWVMAGGWTGMRAIMASDTGESRESRERLGNRPPPPPPVIPIPNPNVNRPESHAEIPTPPPPPGPRHSIWGPTNPRYP